MGRVGVLPEQGAPHVVAHLTRQRAVVGPVLTVLVILGLLLSFRFGNEGGGTPTQGRSAEELSMAGHFDEMIDPPAVTKVINTRDLASRLGDVRSSFVRAV